MRYSLRLSLVAGALALAGSTNVTQAQMYYRTAASAYAPVYQPMGASNWYSAGSYAQSGVMPGVSAYSYNMSSYPGTMGLGRNYYSAGYGYVTRPMTFPTVSPITTRGYMINYPTSYVAGYGSSLATPVPMRRYPRSFFRRGYRWY